MMENKTGSETSWHREPYVWMIIAFPLMAIVGGIITIWLAVNSDDGLVVDDYYKKGLEINRTLQRDIKAENYGIKANIDIDQTTGLFTLVLDANKNFSYPAQLIVKLMHATKKDFDQEHFVNMIDRKKYQIKIPELTRGTWYIQIEESDWRLIQSIFID